MAAAAGGNKTLALTLGGVDALAGCVERHNLIILNASCGGAVDGGNSRFDCNAIYPDSQKVFKRETSWICG